MSDIEEQVIMSGTWIYGDESEWQVHVVKANFRAGTRDHDDAPDVRHDQHGVFFDVRFGEYDDSVTHGGAYTSLEEALEYAKSVCPSLKWIDSPA